MSSLRTQSISALCCKVLQHHVACRKQERLKQRVLSPTHRSQRPDSNTGLYLSMIDARPRPVSRPHAVSHRSHEVSRQQTRFSLMKACKPLLRAATTARKACAPQKHTSRLQKTARTPPRRLHRLSGFLKASVEAGLPLPSLQIRRS